MTLSGEVRFKVRYNALLLQEFTVEQLLAITGLGAAGVRNELRRMIKEGFLVAERLEASSKGVGAPPCLYKLSPDATKRLELSRSIEAFYVATAPGAAEPRRPSSHHFFAAVRLLDQATREQPDGEQRRELLARAQHHLDLAYHEEGVGREGTGMIEAYLAREQGRLAAISGNLAPARGWFRRALAAFQAADLTDEVRRTDEHLICLELRQRITEATEGDMRDYRTIAQVINATLSPAGAATTNSPFALLILEICEPLARMPQPLWDLMLDEAYRRAEEMLQEAAQRMGERKEAEEYAKRMLSSSPVEKVKKRPQEIPPQAPPYGDLKQKERRGHERGSPLEQEAREK